MIDKFMQVNDMVTTEAKRCLAVCELAKMLSLTTKAVYAMVARRQIPYYKIGRRVRFDSQKIQEWLNKKEINPIWAD